MINIPLTKILFLDIETVGGCKDYDTCKKSSPRVAEQFRNYFDWFQKRFPEDHIIVPKTKIESDARVNEVFRKRTALVPEFAKIVCVTMAFVLDSGEIKMQTFSGDDETKLLMDVKNLLDRCHKLDFYLCGHNLKNFDIPMLAKRMIMNGIMPPKILPGHDTKPWEIKALDTKEVWQYGGYGSIASLELMCVCLGVESSKTMEITGNKVHEAFCVKKDIEGIVKYCEKDVSVLIDVIKKLIDLK